MKRGEVCAWDEEEKSVIPLASAYRSEAYCQGFAPESEDQHNAILMAAAPELYEALEKCVKAWDKSWDCSADPGHPMMDEAVDAAVAALRRARGLQAARD